MVLEAEIIGTAVPMIKKLVEELITPKLKRFAKKCKIKYDELLIPRGEHFEEYLLRTYEKYSIINTLVFKNEQRLLKDLYVPLSLVKVNHQRKVKEKVVIDKYPVALVKKYKKVLISDTAGMGKSTLTKRLFLDVVENGHGIPIFIELRRLSKVKPLLTEIQEQINSLTKDFDKELLLTFLQTGGFIFFFDGYDEISVENRNDVTKDIQEFISKAGKNVFFLTSRPEQALACFGDFQEFSINPLEKKEAYKLLQKYDSQGGISKSLVKELKSGRHEMIDEFLKNPLLVSLLFAAYNHKQEVPLKKHIFYRNVYDAYFDLHDLAKDGSFIHEKNSRLDIDEFERVLRYVGYRSLQSQKIEYEKDALLDIIEDAKDFYSDLKFNKSDYLKDLLKAVPLFCQDGQYYRWVHKSLQEYFAAQFIYKDSKSSQDSILKALYESENLEKYLNLLDLYYDIDNWGFRKNITLPLCESYREFYMNNKFTSDNIPEKEIEMRIGILFMREICVASNKAICFQDVDAFQSIMSEFQPYLKHPISLTQFDSTGMVKCYAFDSKHAILNLLNKKMPNLFNNKYVIEHLELEDEQIRLLLPKEIITIDIHTGDNNSNNYKNWNAILINTPPKFLFYLDYKKCKEEIDSIKKIMEKKDNPNILVIGL